MNFLIMVLLYLTLMMWLVLDRLRQALDRLMHILRHAIDSLWLRRLHVRDATVQRTVKEL